MLRVFDLVVGVSVDVIGKETHGLHIGEQAGGVREVLLFDGGEEHVCALQIALCEGLEDIHPEIHLFHLRAVFRNGVCRGAEEVSEVTEHETWHKGVKVYDAEDVAVLVKEHIVHLCVAVADTLGEFSFTVKTLRLAHFLLVGKEVLKDGLHLRLRHTAGFIGLHGLV